jgi:hypothetical protein
VRLAPDPTKLVAVTIPDELILPEVTDPTVIFGVPESPVAVPVTLPTKLVAVTMPVELIFDAYVGPESVDIPETFKLLSCPAVVTSDATLYPIDSISSFKFAGFERTNVVPLIAAKSVGDDNLTPLR